MSFRSRALISLLLTLDRRTNATDEGADDSNVIQDVWFPIAERLTTSDTVEVLHFTPSTARWGDGGANPSNFVYGYGGAWSS